MNTRASFVIVSMIFSVVIIPTFAIVSSSQSNSTLETDLPPNGNETSFASLSRILAETNQTEDDQTSLPPALESESDDQTSLPPALESELENEIDDE